jgi:hypothetical protein
MLVRFLTSTQSHAGALVVRGDTVLDRIAWVQLNPQPSEPVEELL